MADLNGIHLWARPLCVRQHDSAHYESAPRSTTPMNPRGKVGLRSHYKYMWPVSRGREIVGEGTGGMVPSKILNGGGGTEVSKSPSNFSILFLSILMVLCYFFAHLRNNTVGNTGIDTAGQVQVHLLIDLGL